MRVWVWARRKASAGSCGKRDMVGMMGGDVVITQRFQTLKTCESAATWLSGFVSLYIYLG